MSGPRGQGDGRAANAAPLVLASASPQRRAILKCLGIAFEIRAVDVSELEQGEPHQVALENARRKARAAQRTESEEIVLGCDTIVCLEGVIYGKPADEAGARRTLRALGGATHEVLSGLVLLMEGGERSAVARTSVTFRELDDALLDWYVATGEWRGRSGAYAIQKAGAALVRTLQGECENVVGLPVATLLDLYPELLQRPSRA
jgi:septum formation protein